MKVTTQKLRSIVREELIAEGFRNYDSWKTDPGPEGFDPEVTDADIDNDEDWDPAAVYDTDEQRDQHRDSIRRAILQIREKEFYGL